MKRSRGEKIFNFFNIIFFLFLAVIMMVPMLYVLKQSLDLEGHTNRKLTLWPEVFTYAYYRMIVTKQGIYRPFLNSIIITAIGTSMVVTLNAMGAYTMSKRWLRGSKFFVYFLVVIPMVFSGGIIANFLLRKYIGLIDTMWVLILPLAANGWYMILMRNFFWTIPISLVESAQIDGASEYYVFRKIILPLSKAVLAAIGLFAGVTFWNTFRDAIFYINDPMKITFPVKLRSMLFLDQGNEALFESTMLAMDLDVFAIMLINEGLRAAMIIVAVIPVLLVYPFLQRYFTKGLLIGSIKG
jgi:ABC-type glycerol-3-phosphate transport system permease component